MARDKTHRHILNKRNAEIVLSTQIAAQATSHLTSPPAVDGRVQGSVSLISAFAAEHALMQRQRFLDGSHLATGKEPIYLDNVSGPFFVNSPAGRSRLYMYSCLATIVKMPTKRLSNSTKPAGINLRVRI